MKTREYLGLALLLWFAFRHQLVQTQFTQTGVVIGDIGEDTEFPIRSTPIEPDDYSHWPP